MLNINSYGGSGIFSWNKEYLFKVLTTGRDPVLKDPQLINAFNIVDRKDFVPELMKNRAYSDEEISIGYEEKLNRPTVIAQMLAHLKPKAGGKYLDIGTGSGFVAAVLGFVASDSGRVYTIERVQWLWEMARQNFSKYPNVRNVEFLYRDGLEGLPAKAPFDGIHLSFALETVPQELKSQLKMNGGILVCPTSDYNLRIIERNGLDGYTEEIIPGFIFDGGKSGTA